MRKTFKKGDLSEFLLDEEELNELIGSNGAMIDANDNFRSTEKEVRTKGTSKDYARRSAQGPGAYYPFGGAYFGGYYGLNEEDDIETIGEEDDIEMWNKPRMDDEGENIEEELDEIAEGKMQTLVDEMLQKRPREGGFVKRQNENDLMHDVEIPDFSELKSTYEKPIVARKVKHISDLINTHEVGGTELTIILNYFLDNLEITKLSSEQKEFLGDKLKYGGQEE